MKMKNIKSFIITFAAAIVAVFGIYAYTPVYTHEISVSENMITFSDSTDVKTYTCPMHPEVISDKPGKCPQCGMDLELKSEKSGQDDTKKDTHNHKSHKGCKGH